MTFDDLVNWAFAYALLGATAWMLLFSTGAMNRAFAESPVGAVFASIGVVFGWPILAAVFLHGVWCGYRGRKVRG